MKWLIDVYAIKQNENSALPRIARCFSSWNKSPQFAGRQYGDAKLLFTLPPLPPSLSLFLFLSILYLSHVVSVHLAELSRRSKARGRRRETGGEEEEEREGDERRSCIVREGYFGWTFGCGDILSSLFPGWLAEQTFGYSAERETSRSRSNDTPSPGEFRW